MGDDIRCVVVVPKAGFTRAFGMTAEINHRLDIKLFNLCAIFFGETGKFGGAVDTVAFYHCAAARPVAAEIAKVKAAGERDQVGRVHLCDRLIGVGKWLLGGVLRHDAMRLVVSLLRRPRLSGQRPDQGRDPTHKSEAEQDIQYKDCAFIAVIASHGYEKWQEIQQKGAA